MSAAAATTAELHAVIQAALDEAELSYSSPEQGQFFVTLPGTHKLATHCWLVVGRHALLVEAFVCRRPDEQAEELYRFLLRRNARLYGVHYTVDQAGDIYLVGRIGLHAVTAVHDGDFGMMVALRGTDIVRVPLAEGTAKLKTVSAEEYAEVSVLLGG